MILICDVIVPSGGSDINASNRLAIAQLDTNNVYEGVLKPDNIAIHVSQNLVNFVASTIAWAFIAPFYQESVQI